MPVVPNREVAAFSDEDFTLWFSLLDDIRDGTQSSGRGCPRLWRPRPRELTDPDAAPCMLATGKSGPRVSTVWGGKRRQVCAHVLMIAEAYAREHGTHQWFEGERF